MTPVLYKICQELRSFRLCQIGVWLPSILAWGTETQQAFCSPSICKRSHVAGHGMPDRVSPAIVAQIGNLRRDEALQAMSKTHALRHPTLLAIYNYWREKRVKRGKPLLRSLQAPTAPSDSNPYNVFRRASLTQNGSEPPGSAFKPSLRACGRGEGAEDLPSFVFMKHPGTSADLDLPLKHVGLSVLALVL